MASKSMAKKKANDLAEKPEMLGLETFDYGDLIIPRFKIVQPTSKEGTPGLFRNNLTNEAVDILNVVVLAAAKGRVCWSDNIDEDPICRSSNGLIPSENMENPVNEICGTKENGKRFEPVCPNAFWGEKSERPLCDEVINLLCVSKDDHVPFFISLHGTQLKPVRAYLSAVGLRRRSLYEYQATLKLKETANGKGKYFVTQFDGLKENTADEKEAFRALYFQFSGYPIDRTFEAEKAAKEADKSDVPI